MVSVLVAVLFGFAGALAITTMLHTWRRYGRAAIALRGQLADCSRHQEIRWRITGITIALAPARVLRPRFNRTRRFADPALPAAA